MDISEEAFKFAKKNKKKIIEEFIEDNVSSNNSPIFIFMAGAPGAGKTEFSKELKKSLEQKMENGIVRIDADEVREIFRPLGYNGKNSDEYKRGCAKGVEILFDNCIKNKYHTIIDGTLSSRKVAEKNIRTAMEVNANIFVIYVYQDPLVAWRVTKAREKKEGRRIEVELFVRSLFYSISNVDMIKEEYKDRVELWLITKDIFHKTKDVKYDIDSIDKYLQFKYNRKELKKIIHYEEKQG